MILEVYQVIIVVLPCSEGPDRLQWCLRGIWVFDILSSMVCCEAAQGRFLFPA